MRGKKIVVGVSGGIAAYKAVELVRLLVREGAETRVAMTRHATYFVGPLTFETLSGHRVLHDMWGQEGTALDHIDWGQQTDLIVLAPATANFIGKMAAGIADDFLSTMVLASTAGILLCPSMNTRMFEHPAVQANLKVLEGRGVQVMEPGRGELACRTEGAGRLPEPEEILAQAWLMVSERDLAGLKVLVTAGPTVEPLDPVRYISNRSTGRMGYALATAAVRRGAAVTLVSGPTSLAPPWGVDFQAVRTAAEMHRAVLENRRDCDMIIKAAAVSDYRPGRVEEHKIKKAPPALTLELVRNEDILAELGRSKGEAPCILVGFAAETRDLVAHAAEKLKAKNLDLIVANDVSRGDAGFEAETNLVKFIYPDGRVEESLLMPKIEVAHRVLDRAKGLWEEKFHGRKGNQGNLRTAQEPAGGA